MRRKLRKANSGIRKAARIPKKTMVENIGNCDFTIQLVMCMYTYMYMYTYVHVVYIYIDTYHPIKYRKVNSHQFIISIAIYQVLHIFLGISIQHAAGRPQDAEAAPPSVAKSHRNLPKAKIFVGILAKVAVEVLKDMHSLFDWEKIWVNYTLW